MFMGPELSGASATGQPLAQRPRAVFQGEAYRQFVKGLAQANKLVRGELLIDGNAVDASQIACPVRVLAHTGDVLALPDSAHALLKVVSSADREAGLWC